MTAYSIVACLLHIAAAVRVDTQARHSVASIALCPNLYALVGCCLDGTDTLDGERLCDLCVFAGG